MAKKYRVLQGVGYFPVGVEPLDPNDRVTANPGDIVSDMKPEDGDGLAFYGVVEKVVEPKVAGKEEKS